MRYSVEVYFRRPGLAITAKQMEKLNRGEFLCVPAEQVWAALRDASREFRDRENICKVRVDAPGLITNHRVGNDMVVRLWAAVLVVSDFRARGTIEVLPGGLDEHGLAAVFQRAGDEGVGAHRAEGYGKFRLVFLEAEK